MIGARRACSNATSNVLLPPFVHAGDDHHVRSVRAQAGEVSRDAHIAEHNRPTGRLQAGVRHGSEVHAVGLVAVAMHDEVSNFTMERIVEGERNPFEVIGIIGSGTRHKAPPVAKRVGIGVGSKGWFGRCSRHDLNRDVSDKTFRALGDQPPTCVWCG